jgi:hypothetical protein
LCLVLITQSGYALTKPAIVDPSLKLEILYQGNYTPGLRELNQFTSVTQFAFLGYNDILLLSKNDGKVLSIQNYTLLSKPLLDINVTNQWESGLLGIAISSDSGKVYVFLYYTESMSGDVTNSSATDLRTTSFTDTN